MAAIISYLLVLIAFSSIATLVPSEADDDKNFVLVKTKALAKQIPSKSSDKDKEKEGNRKRRDVSANDKVDVVKTINDLRRTVGASDMPYMYWSDQLETDLATWTQNCNFDADVNLTSNYSALSIKVASSWKSNFSVNITQTFNDTRFATMMRSVYITGIAVYETFCNVAEVEYRFYKNVYLSALGFVIQSKFNDSVQQYSIGKACTACLSGIYWCDSGLCRDDCSSSNSECSCDPDCSNVNRVNCTCQNAGGSNGAGTMNANPSTTTSTMNANPSTTTSTMNANPSTTTSTMNANPSTTTSTMNASPSTTTSNTNANPSTTTSNMNVNPSTTPGNMNVNPSTTPGNMNVNPSTTSGHMNANPTTPNAAQVVSKWRLPVFLAIVSTITLLIRELK